MFKNSRTLLQFSIIKDLDRVENTENLDDDVFVEYEEENLFDLFLFNKKDDSSLYDDVENFFFAALPSISEDRKKILIIQQLYILTKIYLLKIIILP